MAASIKITVDGIEDIKRTLERLPILMRGKALESAVRKGGQLIATRAKQLAPVGGARIGGKSGKKHLRDTMSVVIRRRENSVLGVIGPQWPAGAHGHLVEDGTKPHEIATKNKKVLADTANAASIFLGLQGAIFGKTVNHPGSRPHPFLAPAAEEMKGKVEQLIIESLNKAVDKVTANA